jgi:hypothetical protein
MPQYSRTPLKNAICPYVQWILLIGAVVYLGSRIIPALWDR